MLPLMLSFTALAIATTLDAPEIEILVHAPVTASVFDAPETEISGSVAQSIVRVWPLSMTLTSAAAEPASRATEHRARAKPVSFIEISSDGGGEVGDPPTHIPG